MASNFVQRGDVVKVVSPSGGVSSGDLVVINRLVGVATHDAAQDADLELATEGVFTLAKGATTITAGAPVYHSAGVVTPTASANKEVGLALEDRGTGELTVPVVLVKSVRAGAPA